MVPEKPRKPLGRPKVMQQPRRVYLLVEHDDYDKFARICALDGTLPAIKLRKLLTLFLLKRAKDLEALEPQPEPQS